MRHQGLAGLISIIIVVSILATVPNHWLSFDRTLIEGGEWWRLLSGNFVHTNRWHLLINIAGLITTFALFNYHFRGLRGPALLVALCWVVGLGIWCLCPATRWYMGLSGALYGMFCFGAVQCIRQCGQERFGWLLLSGVAFKLLQDSFLMPSETVAVLISARVHIESHLIGAVAGAVIGVGLPPADLTSNKGAAVKPVIHKVGGEEP